MDLLGAASMCLRLRLTCTADRQKPPNRRSGPKVRQHHVTRARKTHSNKKPLPGCEYLDCYWRHDGTPPTSRRRCRDTAPAYPNADTTKPHTHRPKHTWGPKTPFTKKESTMKLIKSIFRRGGHRKPRTRTFWVVWR